MKKFLLFFIIFASVFAFSGKTFAMGKKRVKELGAEAYVLGYKIMRGRLSDEGKGEMSQASNIIESRCNNLILKLSKHHRYSLIKECLEGAQAEAIIDIAQDKEIKAGF